MSSKDLTRFEAITAEMDMDLPPDLVGDAIGRRGWNSFVEDFKERQRQMEGFGPHGIVGSEDLKKFQKRFNDLDPRCATGERRFGYVDLIFDAFIVARLDESGRESIDLKSAMPNAENEQIRRASCNTHLFNYETPIGDAGKLLCIKLVDIMSDDKQWFDEYLQDPSSGIYIPAANLLEK